METSQKEKLLGQWWKARLAHEATMLQDAQQTLAQDRAATKAHLENAHGRPLETPEDDMGIHIGDSIVHQAPKASKLATAALVGASLLGGGVGAAGVGALFGLFNKTPVAEQPAQPKWEAMEFDIEWKVWPDGKASHKVTPVPPKQ